MNKKQIKELKLKEISTLMSEARTKSYDLIEWSIENEKMDSKDLDNFIVGIKDEITQTDNVLKEAKLQKEFDEFKKDKKAKQK